MIEPSTRPDGSHLSRRSLGRGARRHAAAATVCLGAICLTAANTVAAALLDAFDVVEMRSPRDEIVVYGNAALAAVCCAGGALLVPHRPRARLHLALLLLGGAVGFAAYLLACVSVLHATSLYRHI